MATLPNFITLVRIALVPLFAVLGFSSSTAAQLTALGVFWVASASDFLDGHLARRKDVVSRAGEFLDPLADKLLVGAALVVLVMAHGFPLWAAVVIGIREAGVQLLRSRIVAAGGTLSASKPAKVKTILQIVMTLWWLLPWGSLNPGHWILLGAAVGVTVISGAEYFIAAVQTARAAREPGS
ncbi:MAG TPA: CDP-diacylglycerol--glycerol-3-phosphate 3-phosphatidyltransferase [Actinomycetota bacterium]|nr:CDP-diacylglycerol--glycerol-3-phosphate 3-phosphatidyltransferase [Actinomycetota bacterium]